MTEYNHLRETLTLNDHQYEFYNVEKLDKRKYAKLPHCMRILLETLVRNYDDLVVKQEDVRNVLAWSETHRGESVRVPFIPSRVVLQDFSGIPAILNFASMRDACNLIDSNRVQYVNPLCPTDLVLDHAIVDSAKKITVQKPSTNETIHVETGYIKCPFHDKKTECAELVERNRNLEFDRSKERLAFLKWASKSFKNILLIPPFNGISHQTNIECLTRVVFSKNNILYPDSLCGTDTHSPLLNALGVFSLNIGAIEAETVMLNQPYYINLPHVVGYKLTGIVNDTVTSIDVTLAIVKHLRQLNLNNKYIEFYGDGVKNLSISERESISYMCNEYCALVSYFPMDSNLIDYLSKSGRSAENVACIESYLKAAKLFQNHNYSETESIEYSEVHEFDLSTIVATCSGPKRSQDKVNLADLCSQFKTCLLESPSFTGYGLKPEDVEKTVEFTYGGEKYELTHGSVVNASIASYTNTSNPVVMLAAGLLAKKAFEFGLKKKPYIKTSLSPGSGLITKNYLTKSGMLRYFAAFGFNIIGYGCSECIDNVVDLPSELVETIEKNQLVTVGVLSGNRNFENRINTVTKANYLVSPALVIVYAITGRINFNFDKEPIGYKPDSNEAIYLKDIWPTRKQLQELELNVIIPEIYDKIGQNIWRGNSEWDSLDVNEKSLLYNWNSNSTYIRSLPFLDDFKKEQPKEIEAIKNANVLVFTRDSITTDHISAAGSIPRTSPAAKYLVQKKVQPRDFNSFGSRRGNFEIMSRATFSNIRLINELVKQQQNGKEASVISKTLYIPLNKEVELFEAVEMYKQNQIPLIIIAGLNYGNGPSRDWAVKGQWLLGIKAILAESFDQDHRINLIRVGILPLKFLENENASSLSLTGKEKYTIDSVKLESSKFVDIHVDNKFKFQAEVCIYNQIESNYYRNGGQINYLTRKYFLKSCN